MGPPFTSAAISCASGEALVRGAFERDGEAEGEGLLARGRERVDAELGGEVDDEAPLLARDLEDAGAEVQHLAAPADDGVQPFEPDLRRRLEGAVDEVRDVEERRAVERAGRGEVGLRGPGRRDGHALRPASAAGAGGAGYRGRRRRPACRGGGGRWPARGRGGGRRRGDEVEGRAIGGRRGLGDGEEDLGVDAGRGEGGHAVAAALAPGHLDLAVLHRERRAPEGDRRLRRRDDDAAVRARDAEVLGDDGLARIVGRARPRDVEPRQLHAAALAARFRPARPCGARARPRPGGAPRRARPRRRRPRRGARRAARRPGRRPRSRRSGSWRWAPPPAPRRPAAGSRRGAWASPCRR